MPGHCQGPVMARQQAVGDRRGREHMHGGDRHERAAAAPAKSLHLLGRPQGRSRPQQRRQTAGAAPSRQAPAGSPPNRSRRAPGGGHVALTEAVPADLRDDDLVAALVALGEPLPGGFVGWGRVARRRAGAGPLRRPRPARMRAAPAPAPAAHTTRCGLGSPATETPAVQTPNRRNPARWPPHSREGVAEDGFPPPDALPRAREV